MWFTSCRRYPRAHPDYTLPKKAALDAETLSSLKDTMGSLDYKTFPFPQRIRERKQTMDEIIGIPTSGRWNGYFNDEDPGLKLDFVDESSIPPKKHVNKKPAPEHAKVVYETIATLEGMGVMDESPGNIPSYRENPMFVIPSGLDWRMIVDVSSLGPFILNKRFRFEDFNAWLMNVEENSWLFHHDLKKSYYLYEMNRKHVKYLGFNYVTAEGKTRHMRMLALPMGLNPACEIFTSFDKLLIKNFRSELGAHLYPFLDDLTGAVGGTAARPKANAQSREIAHRKAAIGEVLSIEKSTIEAVQDLETVGWRIKTSPVVTLEPKPSRMERTIGLVKSLLDRIKPVFDITGRQTGVQLIATPREAAEVGGLYQSNGKVTPGISMFLRALYSEAAKGAYGPCPRPGEPPRWDLYGNMKNSYSLEAIYELLFLESFTDLSKAPIRRKVAGLRMPPFNLKHLSDSSEHAYGLLLSRYLNFADAKQIIQGNKETARRVSETALDAAFRMTDEALGPLKGELRPLLSSEVFNDEDAEAGSMLRELIPMVLASLIIFSTSMKGLALGLYTDNSGVPIATKQGSRYPKIQALTRAFANCSLRNDLYTHAFWIPREEEPMVILADTASRISDNDDYIFTQLGFNAFFGDKSYGWQTPLWDLCASKRNAKVLKFWSQTYSEGCSGVSVCDTCWPATVPLYIFPPIKLHVATSPGKGAIIPRRRHIHSLADMALKPLISTRPCAQTAHTSVRK